MKITKTLFFICFILLFAIGIKGLPNYITDPNPFNGEHEISFGVNVATCVNVTIPQGCIVDIYFYENSSGTWEEYYNQTDMEENSQLCPEFYVEDCSSRYYWRVIANFWCDQPEWFQENHTYHFYTQNCTYMDIYPSNNSGNLCPCCLALCITLNNLSGGNIKMAFLSNYTGIWKELEEDRLVPANNTYCMCVPEFVWFNYTYYWRVVYNTGHGTNYTDIYSFTTAENIEDCPCGEGYRGEMLYRNPDFTYMGIFGVLGLIIFIGMIGRRKK